MLKRLVPVLVALCVLAFPVNLFAAQEIPQQVKELNFVYLHGAAGYSGTMQLLSDSINEQAQAFVFDYESKNPGVKVLINVLQRQYPGDVDVEQWANNVAESIDKHFAGKNNLILIGHSFGGKAALYAVARNVRSIANRVSMVVSINSPIKSLDDYYITGGGSAADYCRVLPTLGFGGVCDSLGYDSSQDGSWVSHNKHWLAFVSAESAPLSPQFNIGSVDAWPRDMDDGVLPISSQYSDGADVVYYGEYGHSAFGEQQDVASFVAERVLGYIFGVAVDCSVFSHGGTYEHHAGWFPVKYSWDDVFDQVPATGSDISHTNQSYWQWQEWEDVVGACSTGSVRSSYDVKQLNFLPVLSGIEEVRWLNPDTPDDCRLYVRSKAAPRMSIQYQWTVSQHELLAAGGKRDHYEIRVLSGTPQAGTQRALWTAENVRDVRLRAISQIDGPFRWFQAEWKIFNKQSRKRNIIDEIPTQQFTGFLP